MQRDCSDDAQASTHAPSSNQSTSLEDGVKR
jgi:hypothetical protein